jgi:hypothetical protein
MKYETMLNKTMLDFKCNILKDYMPNNFNIIEEKKRIKELEEVVYYLKSQIVYDYLKNYIR